MAINQTRTIVLKLTEAEFNEIAAASQKEMRPKAPFIRYHILAKCKEVLT